MATASALIGVMIALYIFIIVIIIIPMVVALWFMFRKADEPGWAAIVPLYNSYVLYKITWGNGWYCLMAIVPSLICNILQWSDKSLLTHPFNSTGSGILWFIYIILLIGSSVIGIITTVKLAKAFGKGGGWACGLIFLAPVFWCITGFSKNIFYVGVPGKTQYNAAGDRPLPIYQTYQSPYTNAAPETDGDKYCAYCGTRLDNNEKYCPKCGKMQ